MTDEELKAIEERAEKATDGPWVAMHYGPEAARYPGWYVDCNPPDVLQVAMIGHGYGGNGEAEANARFVAHARADVPALCGLVRKLQWELSEARMWLGRFQNDHDAYALGMEVGQHEERRSNRALLAQCRDALSACCSLIFAHTDEFQKATRLIRRIEGILRDGQATFSPVAPTETSNEHP